MAVFSMVRFACAKLISMTYIHLDLKKLRDPADFGALTESGTLAIQPSSFWAQFTREERYVFGLKHSLYSFPTTELVAWLRTYLGYRTAIEIGAGAGILAKAVGLRATDSRMQERPDIRAQLAAMGHGPVQYGEHVEKLDAELAVTKYRPEVVVACWVTHKYKQSESWREGNQDGVDERKLLRSCDYVFIGHDSPHKLKPILDIPHETLYPDWLTSRAAGAGRDFIKIWKKGRY